MTRRVWSGPVAVIPCLAVCVLSSSAVSARLAAQAPTAEAHKQWMNDASDAQEDYRVGVAEKDSKGAGEALVKIEALMARTEEFWTAKKSADGIRLSRQSRALATEAAAAVKAGNMAKAGEAFDKLSASCNACHELQLEKR